MASTSSQDIFNSIIFISFFTMLCSLLWLLLTFQLFFDMDPRRRKRVSNRKARLNVLTVYLCVSVSTLCEWADLVRHIICYASHRDLYFYPINNIMGCADLLHYMGSILFYIIAMLRLQISFHATQYAISCGVVGLFYSLIGMYMHMHMQYTLSVHI